MPIPELDTGCSITRLPVESDRSHKKRLTKVASFRELTFHTQMHLNCSHNQLCGVANRVIGVVPHPTSEGLKELELAAIEISRMLPKVGKQDEQVMVDRYGGSKRRRYQEAHDHFAIRGVTRRDAGITAFAKTEKFDPEAKVNPHPRMIQFRGPVYCVALAAYLQPVEHSVYLMDKLGCGVPHSRNIAKGLNTVQRARLLVEKSFYFTRPQYLSLDASRFDKHVSLELLQIEHSIYLKCNPDPRFRQLLSWQLVNKCRSDLGMKYVTRGRRMSGDMNTAVGNCLLMCTMMRAYFNHLSLKKWDFLDDGDDIVVIVEEESLDMIRDTVVSHFLKYGMSMKLEGVETSIHRVEFCQARTVFTQFGPKFVRNPRAILSKSLCGARHWEDLNYVRKVLTATGLCEYVINMGVPVLEAFSLALIRNFGKSGGTLDLSKARDGIRMRAEKDLESIGKTLEELINMRTDITHEARVTFEEAWGITPAEQVALEYGFSKWSVDLNRGSIELASERIRDWIFQFEEFTTQLVF